MPVTSENEKQVWLAAIHKELQECNAKSKYDFTISYAQVSKAFPAGPHSGYFDLNAINFHALELWANENGWIVKTAPEVTDPDHLNAPEIRFTKK